MKAPQGYTIIEAFTAFAFVFVLIATGIVLAGPREALDRAYRDDQLHDVGQYMEALLSLQAQDTHAFYELILQAKDEKRMIGIGLGCDGSFGLQCMDEVLSDSCLDVGAYVRPEIQDLPFDRSDAVFSRVRTGYYIHFENDVLEIGACSPVGESPVFLMSFIQ